MQIFLLQQGCAGEERHDANVVVVAVDRTVARPGAAGGAVTAGSDPQQTAVPLPTASLFYIAVGCACLLIAVLVTGLTVYYTRSRKLRRQGDMLQ